jgi:hypothetical protein
MDGDVTGPAAWTDQTDGAGELLAALLTRDVHESITGGAAVADDVLRAASNAPNIHGRHTRCVKSTVTPVIGRSQPTSRESGEGPQLSEVSAQNNPVKTQDAHRRQSRRVDGQLRAHGARCKGLIHNPLGGALMGSREGELDVGVLYLPGVGRDGRAEDLRRLTDSIAVWLDDWLTEGRGAAARTGLPHVVTWSNARLNADGEEPAHTVLSVPVGTGSEPVSVAIAASGWRAGLGEPDRGVVAGWLIRLLPMLVLEHFHAALFREAAPGRPRLVRLLVRAMSVVVFLAAVPLATLLLSALLLIALLSRLPLPGLGTLALALETRLAARFGYSLALSGSPTRFLSAVEAASAELDWLAGRCRRVVMLGFSQGAVVAHEVARRRPPENLALLATVGSALRTFYEMPNLAVGRSSSWRTLGNIAVTFPFVAFYVIPAITIIFINPLSFGGLSAVALLALWSSIVLALMLDALRAGRPLRAARRLRLPGAGDRFSWIDYVATADPVPQGALVEAHDAAQFGGWPTFVPVSNEAAVWRDHKLYWANREEFLADLIRRVLAAGGVELTRPAEAELLAAARRRRAARVAALSRARLVVAGLAAAVGVRLLDTWERLGTDLLSDSPQPLRSPIAKLLEPFAPFYPGQMWAGRLAGLVVWAAACFALLYVVHLMWLGWQARDVQRLFAREPYDTGGPARLAFSLLTGVSALIVIWAVTGDALPDAAGWLIDLLPTLPRPADDVAFVSVAGAVGVWVLRRRPGRGDVYAVVRFFGFLLLLLALLSPFEFRRWAVDVDVSRLLGSLIGVAVGAAVAWLPPGGLRHLVALARSRLARVPDSAPDRVPGHTAEGAVELGRLWHGDSVNALAITTDRRLLTGSSDTTACLWPRQLSGDPLTFHHGNPPVTAVAVSVDGAMLVTGGRGRVIVWDARTGQRVVQFEPYGRVACVAVSPAGDAVLIGGEDGAVLRPLHGGAPVQLTAAETSAAVYVPGGLWLATAFKLLFLPDSGPRETVYEVPSAKVTTSSGSFALDGRAYVVDAVDTVAGRRGEPSAGLHVPSAFFTWSRRSRSIRWGGWSRSRTPRGWSGCGRLPARSRLRRCGTCTPYAAWSSQRRARKFSRARGTGRCRCGG